MDEQEFREPTDANPTDEHAQLGEQEKEDRTEIDHLQDTEMAHPIGVSVEANATVEWNEEHQQAALSYPVVGIGSSAGGLQALREILGTLPENTGMAYVIISHLAPDQRSYLSEILARHTTIQVQTIEEGLQPQPDNIYVLPPGQVAFLEQGTFHVERRDIGERNHFPIDAFFRSLASDQKSYSLGVVLSGADGDGTLGVKAIKGEGGLCLAQSPETAEHASMPLSSIEMDHIDFIGSPADIGVELGRLGHLFALPQIRSLENGQPITNQEQSLQRILQILRNATGLDLRPYKPETIRRRIARRMVVRRIESLNEYARLLQLRPDEVRTLHEDVLINVTRFFRDPEFWNSLSTHVLPTFFQNHLPEKPVRIWCAGCATGEEAYSLAIAVLEYLTANGMDTTVQVFGTDASEYAVETARTAIYPESLVAEIAPERLRRFFTKVDRGYQVSKRVRDCCIFARQNLASDPPFSHIDLLSCRNVIIYFNQALQKQVITTFHYSLESDGYLLLGMSESLRDYSDFFNAFDRKNKIYSKIGGVISSAHRFPQAFTANLLPSSMRIGDFSSSSDGWSELELQRAADRIVLARYAPPGLIVDDHLKVLQARGQTAPYVELTPGAVSWNLSRVLRDEIAVDVRGAVERAVRENVPIAVSSTLLEGEDENKAIHIEVLPITSAAARSRCFLVLFSKAHELNKEKVIDQIVQPELTGDGKEKIIAQLRQDLTSTRFHLQSLIEERDARNQELVSANEEIQSANEELQSTNEELETTKEELQSANEELQTVNEELQQRNAILTQTGNDLTNLLNSVNMPLLMLTEELKIRQFTPPMEKLLSIRAADIGRSISEIRLQLSVEDIEPILIEVLDTLGTREIEVQDREEKWHLLRVRPYRTADNKIEGLVVLLVDIDQLRSSQQELRYARDFASTVVQSVPVPVVVLERNGSIKTVNKAFRDLIQMKENELEGRSFSDLVGHLWGLDDLAKRLEDLSHAEAGNLLEFEHQSTTSQDRSILIKGQSLPIDGDRILLLTLEDVTLRRQTEQMANQQQEALQNEVETKSRTLLRAQEELRELAAHLFTMQEDERQRVARELHDDISQRLTMLEMLCAKAQESKTEDLSSIRREVQSLNSDVREISHRLHPAILNDLGLSEAIKALVEDFRQRERMPATYSETGISDTLPPTAGTALYRITQEALRNVGKHAGETHVKVDLDQVDGSLRLQVRDFGIGFDQDIEYPVRGLGLVSMEERARIAGGTFSIDSSLGNGTKIIVEIPLEPHA